MNQVFEKYKNVHEGKRAFLIANGPSLNQTNLDLIENEISFAMNRISLKYDQTSWRPTYYLFSSTNVTPSKPWSQEWQSSVRQAIAENRTTSFVAERFRRYIDPLSECSRVEWFDSMSERKPDKFGNIHPSCFSTNVVERIDKTGTTMNLALQLCFHMGISEIVFVGADLGWTRDEGTNNDPNHFSKNYVAEITKPEKANNQMRNVHSLSGLHFKMHKPDTKIYNASKRTVLDVYPIIDFERYVECGEIVLLDGKRDNAKKFWESPPQYGYFDEFSKR
jgi:hypothetical protein